MKAASVFIAQDALGISPFYGCDVSGQPTERAVISALHELKSGHILRLFIDENPLALIQKQVLNFGSQLIFQYLLNREGAVIIDFKKIRD